MFLLCFFMLVLHGCDALDNGGNAAAHATHGYHFGAPVKMECRTNDNATWSHAPIQCVHLPPGPRTLFELDSFKFGVDSFYQCIWAVSAGDVPFLTACINRLQSLRCRALMVPGHDFWIPFDVPIWGVDESTHIHVDNHVNFIFHAARGSLMAAAAYPIRDQFGYIDKNTGGVVNLHGHVKFFTGESYIPASQSNNFAFIAGDVNAPKMTNWAYIVTVFVFCFITCFLTGLAGMAYYVYRIQPNHVRKVESKID